MAESRSSDFCIIFSAPTAYGKSRCTQAIAHSLLEAEGIIGERLIHILPLRAIVEQLYSDAKEKVKETKEGISIGYQAMHFLDAEKTPYFLYQLVYTTFDSFIHNLFKVPVAEYERIHAHYDIPRYAIYSGLIVFDEVHLFSSEEPLKEEGLKRREERTLTAFCAAINSLTEAKVPVLIMTATLPDALLEGIVRNIRSSNIFLVEYDPKLSSGERVEEELRLAGKTTARVKIGDQEYTKFAARSNAFLSKDKPFLKDEAEVVEISRKYAEEDKQVLVVRNTVKKAVQTYEQLRRVGESVLIHGRLTTGDRNKALRRVERAEYIVATQAIEAGVNLDCDVLITDATTLTSLIQRIGRLKRKIGREGLATFHMIEGEGDGVYNAEFVRRTLELLRREETIGWRLPAEDEYISIDGRRFYSYKGALQTVYSDFRPTIDGSLRQLLVDIDAYPEAGSRFAREMLARLCNFVREEGLVALAVANKIETQDVRELLLPLTCSRLLRNDNWKTLLRIEGRKVGVLVRGAQDYQVQYDENVYKAFEEAHKECILLRQLEGALKRFRRKALTAIALCVNPNRYEAGVGLRLD